METKSNSHSQNNIELVMIICEERHTLRTLFDNIEPSNDGKLYINPEYFKIMHIRSIYNPDLIYYIVDCEAYKRYGYTADELFDDIENKYIESNYRPLDELFTFIERI